MGSWDRSPGGLPCGPWWVPFTAPCSSPAQNARERHRNPRALSTVAFWEHHFLTRVKYPKRFWISHLTKTSHKGQFTIFGAKSLAGIKRCSGNNYNHCSEAINKFNTDTHTIQFAGGLMICYREIPKISPICNSPSLTCELQGLH